jgi:hypothetical protein
VAIEIGDCRLRRTQSAIAVINLQSESPVVNLNRQSTIETSAIDDRQTAMFLLDSMLVGGLRFVFDKIAAAVDTELNDDTALRERLLAAQMRVELGEMTEQEFDALEADILARLREIRDRRQGAGAAVVDRADVRVR